MMQNSPVIQKVLAKIADYISPQTPSKLLVGLIFFFSATQLGFHFWPDSSLVYGVRVDYLSPTIYFLDLLIIFYLFSSGYFKKYLKISAWSLVINPILLFFLLPNLLYSLNPLATLTWSLHFCLYTAFLVSLRPTFNGVISAVLLLSLLFQLTLSLIQVKFGHSIGGLLYYVGERNVAVGSPGIALGSYMGEVILRAYGTFGHPNVLAGWAVLSLLILLRLKTKKYLLVSATVLTTILVMLSQSRAAALSIFGLIIPFYFLSNLKTRAFYFLIFLTTSLYLLSYGPFLRPDTSLSERRTLQSLSWSIIKSQPIFGTGANASISTYPMISPEFRLFQPDHNSLTLFISWFGIFGVLAIIYYLKTYLKFNAWNLLTYLLPILPFILFDHYILTSPQGLFTSLVYLWFLKLQQLNKS